MTRRIDLQDGLGVVAEIPGLGAVVAGGTATPSSGAIGYAPGCAFVKTTAPVGIQINQGTAASASFAAVADTLQRTTVADVNYTVLASDSIIAYTTLTNARTVTVNPANLIRNKLYTVQDESGNITNESTGASSGGNITITKDSSTKVFNGFADTACIFSNYGRVQFYTPDGVHLLVIGDSTLWSFNNLNNTAQSFTGGTQILGNLANTEKAVQNFDALASDLYSVFIVSMADGGAMGAFISTPGAYLDGAASGGNVFVLDVNSGCLGRVSSIYGTDLHESLDLTAGAGSVKIQGSVGFYGHSVAAKPTVSGSAGTNAALISLLSGLAGLGLITDSHS